MFDVRPFQKILNGFRKGRCRRLGDYAYFPFSELGPVSTFDGFSVALVLTLCRFLDVLLLIMETHPPSFATFLSDDEVAFYNALEVCESAVKILGDDTLRDIAREITDKVKANTTIDWTIRQSGRDRIMVLVRRTLAKHGYQLDKQQKAVDTILKQAELLADLTVNT